MSAAAGGTRGTAPMMHSMDFHAAMVSRAAAASRFIAGLLNAER
jgi:hypothetical protein